MIRHKTQNTKKAKISAVLSSDIFSLVRPKPRRHKPTDTVRRKQFVFCLSYTGDQVTRANILKKEEVERERKKKHVNKLVIARNFDVFYE